MDLVVNASPLILLCKINKLKLLHQLCRSVYVPEGVICEIEADLADSTGLAVKDCPWINKVTAFVPDSIKAWDIGRGESEVVAYALENHGSRPLLDDAKGKACALAFGLKPLGTGGLLVLAKRAGVLDLVEPVLCEMRAEGLWISDTVYRAILAMASE